MQNYYKKMFYLKKNIYEFFWDIFLFYIKNIFFILFLKIKNMSRLFFDYIRVLENKWLAANEASICDENPMGGW